MDINWILKHTFDSKYRRNVLDLFSTAYYRMVSVYTRTGFSKKSQRVYDVGNSDIISTRPFSLKDGF